mgnify:FL=1
MSVAESSGTTVIVYDDTKMTSSEGNEFLTRTITPTNSSNILYVEGSIQVGFNGSSIAALVGLFQDSIGDSLAAWDGNIDDANTTLSIPFHYQMAAGTTSQIEFKIRAGSNTGGTFFMNKGNASLWGGVVTSMLKVIEVRV